MKAFYLIILAAALANVCHAQVTFQKTYGATAGSQFGQGSLTTPTSDGGYATVSETTTLGAGGFDMYVVRTDNVGHLLWTKTFGSTYDDVPASIEQTTDHGFIITGSTRRIIGNGLHYDIVLIKTDSLGDTVWTKTYGQDMTDENAWCGRQTLDGGYIAVGTWGGSSYTYIVKTNSTGDTLWTRVYDGGTATSVRQLPDSSYIISGIYFSPDTHGQDFFLMHISKHGDVFWEKSLGLLGTEYQSVVRIDNIDSAGYILTGAVNGDAYGFRYKAYIIRTDTFGNAIWSKTYGDSSSYILGLETIPTPDGYTILAYTTSTSGYAYPRLIKTNRTGNVQWSRNFSYQGYPRHIERTADKGYVFSTGYDVFNLTKTDSLGNSGCQESDIITYDSTVTTLVYTVQVGRLSGTSISNPHLTIGTGGTENEICLNTGVASIPVPTVEVSVYPNPASNELIIESHLVAGTETVKIYNLLGAKIYEGTMNAEGNKIINAENFPCGLYMVTVAAGNRVITNKIMVAR